MTENAPSLERIAPVTGRFAPSPSGRMHLGNVFSALIAWLSARSQNGRMVLRIEDLDERTRNPENTRLLIEDLEWLGLDWDGDIVYQSRREDLYAQALDRLDNAGLIYPCFCSRQELHAASAPHASDGTYVYQGTCRGLDTSEIALRSKRRSPAMRLIVPASDDPAGNIVFTDKAFGKVAENLGEDCGDFLVRRSDGVYAYQLAVVVDDADMGVTEVVRGVDLLHSSARQRYLQRILGLPNVEYGHVPLLVAPDGRRLSKRDADLDMGALRAKGIEPQAIIGGLASLVNMAEPGEHVTPPDLVKRFSWSKLQNVGGSIAVNDGFYERG
jgi:glutamyl-tRNA synthetase